MESPKGAIKRIAPKNPFKTRLTDAQKNANYYMRRGYNVFLTGPAGTGKTHVICAFKQWCLDNRKKVAITSTTGTSAILIGGRTIHSWAGIDYGDKDADIYVQNIYENPHLLRRWRMTQILVIDEISMMNPELFEKLDYIARSVRWSNSQPFGGIQVVLSGDFAQLPPVKSPKYCFETPLWEELLDVTIYFTEIIRQCDPVFQSLLCNIRMGKLTPEHRKILMDCVGRDLETVTKAGIVIKPTQLHSHKVDVKNINDRELAYCKKHRQTTIETRTTGAVDASVVDASRVVDALSEKDTHDMEDKHAVAPIENESGEPLINTVDGVTYTYTAHYKYVNTLRLNLSEGMKAIMKDTIDRNAPILNELELVLGAQVMLAKNLCLEDGLANGSRGVIIDFICTEESMNPETGARTAYPIVEFVNGHTRTIRPEKWQYIFEETSEGKTSIKKYQIPLVLAFATTIHKSQGMTIDLAEEDLSRCFDFGQAYTALSRVRSLQGLSLVNFSDKSIKADPRVVAYYSGLKTLNKHARFQLREMELL